MSQTCVMLTVLAPKPNPLLASARRAMAVVQIRAWARIRLQCGRLVKQCYTLPVICGARPIRTRENNRAIFDHAANHHRRELTRPSTLKPLLTAVAK